MQKSLLEMASEIVIAQASNVPMSSEDISIGVRKIFQALQKLQRLEAAMSGHLETADSFSAPDSIQRNRVICLECHREFKLLSHRHLALHGMTAREYKLKYGLPLRRALTARSAPLARRKIAPEETAVPGSQHIAKETLKTV